MNDLLFVGEEPTGRVCVETSPLALRILRRDSPQKYFKTDDGEWVWEGHCGQFKDGTVRPPWLDAEWRRRFDDGDPTYGDSSTYDLTPPLD